MLRVNINMLRDGLYNLVLRDWLRRPPHPIEAKASGKRATDSTLGLLNGALDRLHDVCFEFLAGHMFDAI